MDGKTEPGPARMKTQAPQIFDRRLWRMRRARASLNFQNFSFLVQRAAIELRDRLNLQTGRLESGVLHGAVTAESLGLPDEVMIRSDPAMPFGSPFRGSTVFDEEALPFAPGRLDLYVSMMTLHTVNDLPGTLIQIRRTLKPDGLFLAALLGGETLKEWRAAIESAELEMEGGVSPRVAPFIDVKDAGGLLQRAGFARPVADIERVTVSYRDPMRLLRDLKGMAETNVLTERRRSPIRRRTLLRALSQLTDQSGVTFDLLFLTGFGPAARSL